MELGQSCGRRGEEKTFPGGNPGSKVRFIGRMGWYERPEEGVGGSVPWAIMCYLGPPGLSRAGRVCHRVGYGLDSSMDRIGLDWVRSFVRFIVFPKTEAPSSSVFFR